MEIYSHIIESATGGLQHESMKSEGSYASGGGFYDFFLTALSDQDTCTCYIIKFVLDANIRGRYADLE